MSRDHKIRTAEAGFTTGEAARLLSVEPDTVLKWIKRGKLTAVRTPGGHHRIPPAAVEALRQGLGHTPKLQCWQFFAHQDTVRAECLECAFYRTVMGSPPRILVVSPDPAILQAGPLGPGAAQVRLAHSAYEASAIVEEFRPEWAVLDEDLDPPGWRALAADLRADPRIEGLQVILAVSRRGRRVPPGSIVKPFRPADLPPCFAGRTPCPGQS